MNSRALIAVFCTFALVASAAAEDLRKVAEQHAREFVRALKTKDIGWFEKVAAPDYVEIGVNGKKTNRADAIKQMKQEFGAGVVTSATTKILKVSGGKGKMSVLVDAHVVMSVRFNPKAKKPQKLVGMVRMEEHWTKTGGQWLIHELRTVSEKATLDGKPMPSGM